MNSNKNKNKKFYVQYVSSNLLKLKLIVHINSVQLVFLNGLKYIPYFLL